MTEHFTKEEIAAHLTYFPQSGALVWHNPTSNKIKPWSTAGSIDKEGYLRVNFKSKKLAQHRVAWLLFHGEWPRQQIDHINRVRCDNRIENLRDVSPSENIKNSDRRSRVGERRKKSTGRTWNKRSKKWQVQIHDPKSSSVKYIGLFAEIHEADAAYRAALQRFDL